MKKIVLLKENGEIKEVSYSELFENVCSVHLCWNECANATPLKCKKIYDKKKQTIDNYEFITDGFQIIKGNNKVDRFHVSGCNYYEKEPEKEKLTADLIQYYNDIKRNIAMLYYDTDTVEEADELQRLQIEKGFQRKPKKR